MPERLNAGAAGLSPDNAITLDRLVRAIDLAEGFSLFFARCNIPVLRSELILVATQQLAALGVSVVEVAFEDEPANVRERLAAALAAAAGDAGASIPVELPALPQALAVAEPPAGYVAALKRAVFVTGLEYGIPFDQPNARILAELNLGRDAFLRDVPHPLVIWLPDYAVTAVARFAPDFWAWRSGVFEFETGEAERSAAFEQSIWGNRPWHALTNLTPDARLLRRRQLESLLDDYRDLPDDPRMTRERAVILADLGNVCDVAQDYREAITYYKQALPLYHQVGDQSGEARVLNNLGRGYDALGDKRQALRYYEQALLLRRQIADQGGEAATLNDIGGVYDALGEKRKALHYYKQALPLRRKVSDQGGEALTLYSIGGVHDDLGDKRLALWFYEQALELIRQVGDRSGEAATLNNLGLVYAALGEAQKTLDYYEQALSLQRQIGDRSGEATTLHNIGLAYSTLGNMRQALWYFEQALLLTRQVGDRWGESITCYNMALIYEDLGDLARAEDELKSVVELDEAVGHPDLERHQAAVERVRAKRKAGAGKR